MKLLALCAVIALAAWWWFRGPGPEYHPTRYALPDAEGDALDGVQPYDPWPSLAADRAFVAGMARAQEEHDRGEFRPFVHRTPRPDPRSTGRVSGNPARTVKTWTA